MARPSYSPELAQDELDDLVRDENDSDIRVGEIYSKVQAGLQKARASAGDKLASQVVRTRATAAVRRWDLVLKKLEEDYLSPGAIWLLRRGGSPSDVLLGDERLEDAATPEIGGEQWASFTVDVDSRGWSERTMFQIWANAKRKMNAIERARAVSGEPLGAVYNKWKKLADDIFANVSPGARNEYEAGLVDGYPPSQRPGMRGRRSLRISVAGLSAMGSAVVEMFGQSETPFESQPMRIQAMYEMIWKVPPKERASVVDLLMGASDSKSLTESDYVVISTWFADLLQQTMGATTQMYQVVFTGRCINPAVLSFAGQMVFFRLVQKFFADDAHHSGGFSTPLRLRSPRWTLVTEYVAAMKKLILNPPASPPPEPAAAAAAAPRPKRPAPDDEVVPLVRTDSLPSSDVSMFDGPAAGLAAAVVIPSKFLEGVLNADDKGDSIRVGLRSLRAIFYSGVLRAELDAWIGTNTFQPTDMESPTNAEIATTANTLAGLKVTYDRERSALIATVDADIQAKRLLISNDQRDELTADLAELDTNFIGSYRGKTQLVQYLRAQLAGRRPRSETANHLLCMGEPGTGKTTMSVILARMMNNLGLVEPASMDAYEKVGALQRRNMSELAYDTISKKPLPFPAEFVKDMSDDAQFVYRLLENFPRRNEPLVIDPSRLQSVYQGGQVVSFVNSVFSTLGSVLVIDEAYGLGGDKMEATVDALVAVITQLETQWGSILLGYDYALKELMNKNDGLSRRYNTKIEFEPYSAKEITAIAIAKILAADTLVLASSATFVDEILQEEAREDNRVGVLTRTLFDQLLATVGPYALRGTHIGANAFGSMNAGAVDAMVTAVDLAAAENYDTNPAIRLVTPAVVKSVMEASLVRKFGIFAPSRLSPSAAASGASKVFS